VVALAAWGAVATGWLVLHEGAGETGQERESVAVLPFANLSGDPDNEYFSDGVTGDIINHLSKIADLKVISGTWVMKYKGMRRKVREMWKEAETDEHLWAEQYNRELTDVFAIQSDVAQHIALALRTTLTRAERGRIEERPTENLDAYDNYLRGRHFWHQRSLAAFDSAIEYYNRAVLLDPDYARAYAGLAETYALLPEYGGPSIADILSIAKAATDRALTLDPDLAEAYTASAYIKSRFEWDHEGAERDYRKAIELDPDYATAHQWYAEFLYQNRRWDQALVEARRAVELDPQSVMPNTVLAVALACAGRPADAIPAAQRALEIIPDQTLAIKWLAYAYVLNGEPAAAAPLFERFAELTGSHPDAYRAYLAALSDPAKIPAAVTALQAPSLFVPGLEAGGSVFLAHLRQVDEAMAVLEQCYEARWPLLPFVNAHPMFEGLRSDPRFQDLLRRMNFTE
jgi:TolB-like protein/Tfp pilus assembly protein PilF